MVEVLEAEIRRIVVKCVNEVLAEKQGAKSVPGEVEARDLLTYAEASQISGYAPGTIGLFVRQGRLARYGGPRNAQVSRAELDAFMRSYKPRAKTHTPEDRADAILNKKQH